MSKELDLTRPINEMTDEELLAKIEQDLKEAKDARAPKENMWNRVYKLYRNYIAKEDMRAEGANLFIPYTFGIIETETPRIVASMFASKPYVGLAPESEEYVANAAAHESLLQHQAENIMSLVTTLVGVFKAALMYGTAITKEVWKFETKTIIEKVPKLDAEGNETDEEEEVEVDIVTYDDPDVIHIALEDFFVDPYATDIPSARYCAHRIWRDKQYLKEKQAEKIYKNVNDVIDKYENSDDHSLDKQMSIGMTKKPSTGQGIELFEYHTGDYVVTVDAECTTVLRRGRNPFYHQEKPFTRWVDHLVPHEFYGIGEVEPVEDLQLELNTTRNQRIDNVSLIINRMWTVLRSADIKPEQLVSRPNGVIDVDSHDDIKAVAIDDVSISAYREEQVIKEDVDKTLGVFDVTRGATANRRETATTSSLNNQNSNERFKLKIMLFEDMGIKSMARHLVALNQQFKDTDTVVAILGNAGYEFKPVSPSDIAGRFHIVPSGSAIDPVANKEARQNSILQMYNMVKDNPLINQPLLLKRLLETYDFKDAGSLIIAPQPQQPAVVPNVPPELAAMIGGGMMDGQI